MKQTTSGRLMIVGLVWLTARLLFAASTLSLDVAPFSNIVFDEAEYMFESLALAGGEPVVFYKGPFLYLVTAAAFYISPTLLAARGVSLLFDLALLGAFWFGVRRDDSDVAFRGTVLLAACPLSAWFSFHLLTDVPFAIFLFLAVHSFARRDNKGSLIASSVFFALAVLVKSTAILLLPVLFVCALILRRRLAAVAGVTAVPVLLYLAMPFFWQQTPDSHFFSSLPSMSFRCGFFYFAVAAVLAAGPFLTGSAFMARAGSGRPGPGRPWLIAAAVTLAVLYASYTLFGDAQPKYVMTFVPFLALLGGAALERKKAFAVAVIGSLLWITPVAHWMEDDAGMTGVAGWLRNTGSDTVYTTIPRGVHRHAFEGVLHFEADLRLADYNNSTEGLGGFVVWTDWTGDIEGLEASLEGRGLTWRRIDFYTNRNIRPVYLVEGARMPEPERVRWEPNILMRPFITPLDLPVQPAKKAVYRLFRPASPSGR